MRKVRILYIIFFVVLQSCTLDKPIKNEIIGNWYNIDNSSIVFKENGNFYGKDLSVFAFYENDTIDKFNGNGKWKIVKETGKWIVDLSFKEKSIYKNKIVSINSSLIINGDGFFGTKRPIHLYLQVGDPDNDERYEFHKKIKEQ